VQGVSGDDERRMTIVQHLEELRRVLIWVMAAWIVGTAVAFIFNGFFLSLLLQPLRTVLHNSHSIIPGDRAIILNPTEGITIPLKISAVVGVILALPIILWQTWNFVSPGLRPKERKFVGPFIASALLLFAGGAVFAYFVMPLGLNFLANFLSGNAVYFPDLNNYIGFFLIIIFIFGITFEMPVVLILLGLLGFVSSKKLKSWRKVAYVVIIIAALVITPGADPFTPTLLTIPLLLLYEASIIVLQRIFRR
ncbi:MAG: twin-arginine translocase subunit TatC, partial [Candidatus Dormiibacterota bacterium]